MQLPQSIPSPPPWGSQAFSSTCVPSPLPTVCQQITCLCPPLPSSSVRTHQPRRRPCTTQHTSPVCATSWPLCLVTFLNWTTSCVTLCYSTSYLFIFFRALGFTCAKSISFTVGCCVVTDELGLTSDYCVLADFSKGLHGNMGVSTWLCHECGFWDKTMCQSQALCRLIRYGCQAYPQHLIHLLQIGC